MAPGYEDSQKLKQTKSASDYWAHSKNTERSGKDGDPSNAAGR
jgi:hypothetical protein